MSTAILDLIEAARRPETTVWLCLRGDLVSRYEDLKRQLDATLEDDDSFAGSPDTRRIRDELEEIRAQMKAATVGFHLRAIGPTRRNTLIASYPPREGVAHDRALGYNPETLYRALIRECCYALDRDEELLQLRDEDTNKDLEVMTEEQWAKLLGNEKDPGKLGSAQFNRLFGAAWELDANDVEVPTLPLVLQLSQRSDESSKQDSAGEQGARSGGGAGSRRTSRRSSTTTQSPEDPSEQ